MWFGNKCVSSNTSKPSLHKVLTSKTWGLVSPSSMVPVSDEYFLQPSKVSHKETSIYDIRDECKVTILFNIPVGTVGTVSLYLRRKSFFLPIQCTLFHTYVSSHFLTFVIKFPGVNNLEIV